MRRKLGSTVRLLATGRMRLCLLVLVLQLVASSASGQVNSPPQKGASHVPASAEPPPDVVVRELYREVVARHPLGISVGGDLKVFAPYLSKALLQRIDLANACLDDWYRQNLDPNSKPPGLEGGLFTGDDLRAEPQAFHIEKSQTEKDGSIRVYVRLTHDEPGERPWIWRVAAILVRENGDFVVDDVVYLKAGPKDVEVRLSEYLRQGCDGSHWVGYVDSRYPNEVPGYRFYLNVTGGRLKPSVSTMSDVRQVLGNPDEANDVSAYTEAYPGDEKALKPVFKYKFNDDWQLLVYFAKYCFHEVPKGTPADTLCSLDLVPQKPIAFDVSKLPSTFVKTHIQAVDAAWDEYSDGTGLQYEVYATHAQYGSEKPGDLNRISYGPRRKSASAQ
jgi:hypothetical protein